MKEKVYKKVQFYGRLTTITSNAYLMLAPFPSPVKDSWQLKHQQSWYVVPDSDSVLEFVIIGGETKAGYSEPRHIVTSFPTIDPHLSEGYVWTGEYVDDETIANEEPTQEDLQWFHDNCVDVDEVMVEVAND